MKPPVELPTNFPTPPSVSSRTTRLKVNALKKALPELPVFGWSVHSEQDSVKMPKFTLEGIPTSVEGRALKTRLAPLVPSNVKPPDANPVVGELVLYVIGAALALDPILIRAKLNTAAIGTKAA